ncbi:MAG: hypothetical protein R6U36_03010 [Candidatus Fermentibacteraceae bacterium]
MKIRSRPLAGVDVYPDSRWKLGIVARPGREYRLCLRFHVQFNGPEEGFGLVADYTLTAAGETLTRERAGVGDIQPPERDRCITVQNMVTYGTNSLKDAEYGHAMRKATVVLATAGPFPHETELTAEGVTLLSQDTRLASGKVFFA